SISLEIKELFRTFDKDNDRSISTKELGKAMRFLGLNADQENVKKAMKCLDANGNGRIEYKEFLLFMKKEFERDPQCQDEENHIRAAFRMFDRDGNGYIDRKELKYALTNLGEKMSEKEIKDMMRQADVNGDGKIDYEETSLLVTRLVSDLIRKNTWCEKKTRIGRGESRKTWQDGWDMTLQDPGFRNMRKFCEQIFSNASEAWLHVPSGIPGIFNNLLRSWEGDMKICST
ncbi:hypothetical protein FSP39_025506, partial [Pinctada imbricata]